MKRILLPIALSLITMSVNAQISTFPWEDNLEGENNCSGSCNATCNMSGAGFTNDPASSAEWTIDNFGTSSNPTGPQGADHNPGINGGKYAYVESSSPCSSGNPTALLNSPLFDFTNIATPGLTFWYHMYGSSMGTMHVDVQIGGVWTLDIIPPWTDNVDLWQEQVVSMPMLGGLNNVRFRIRGVVGNGFWSDMAVDDFSVYDAVYQVVPVEVNDPLCYGESTGSITVDGLFGIPPFTYAWDNGATGSNITGLSSGTYCVIMTDANLDTVSACFVLNDPDSISVTTTLITPQVCKYDITEANALGSGGIALSGYSVDTNSALFNPDTSMVGTLVNFPSNYSSSIALDIGFDFVFFGDTVSTFKCNSEGFILFEPTWTSGWTADHAIPSVNGPAGVIAFGWENFAPLNGGEVNYYTMGTAPFRTLVVNYEGVPYEGGNNIDGMTVQVQLHETSNCIEIHSTDVGNSIYAGNAVQGIENLAENEAYFLPGRNYQSWSATNDYIRFCPVDTTGLLYSWSSGDFGATVFGLNAGTYTVSATDANGCVGTDELTIDPAPSNLTLTPDISDISCFGFNDGSIESNQTGGVNPINYTWSSGQTSADIANLMQGTYTVVAEDAVGCLDSVTGMLINEPSLLVSSIYSLVASQCPEDQNGSAALVVSGGVAPYDVLWSDGQIGPVASNLAAGSYQAQITDASGCQTFQSAEILAEFNSPNVDLGANITQTAGGTVTLNAGPQSAYLWNTGATSQTIQAALTGIYWVEVYNGNGCSASDSIYVEIWPTGINDIADDAKFALYPNPTSSNLMLNLEGMESASDVTVRIVNVQGQIVIEKVLNTISSTETVELDVNSLAPGMYNLSLKSDAFNAVKSFVKQ
jgi:hypothetical protein